MVGLWVWVLCVWWLMGVRGGDFWLVGQREREREREYLNKVAKKNRAQDVGCIVKQYDIIDKVTFEIVKHDNFQKLDANALIPQSLDHFDLCENLAYEGVVWVGIDY